jgi:predicted metal-dependent hydrolase
VNGEGFFYLGKTYKLQIIDDNLLDIEISDKLCISRKLLPDARNHLKDWYKAEAEKKIIERCAYYTKITGYIPNSVKISNAERRWGSCTSKGTLNFSWRLIMAPLEIIDYVVVHEMIHLNQTDHSKIFWNKVRSILPDYEKRKVWLKNNEKLLQI